MQKIIIAIIKAAAVTALSAFLQALAGKVLVVNKSID